MIQQKQSNDPLWEVVIDVEKDYLYVRKGQTIEEVVQAPDKEAAVVKALRMNSMEDDALDRYIILKSVRLWKDEQEL
jgi:hypothetical protein